MSIKLKTRYTSLHTKMFAFPGADLPANVSDISFNLIFQSTENTLQLLNDFINCIYDPGLKFLQMIWL